MDAGDVKMPYHDSQLYEMTQTRFILYDDNIYTVGYLEGSLPSVSLKIPHLTAAQAPNPIF